MLNNYSKLESPINNYTSVDIEIRYLKYVITTITKKNC